ncbi:MAG: PAS domain S-box protein [Bacteroidetes bacterium]|nr:MAG: PAS domain S-box protein [Bacteroidota bacterium]
MANNGGKQSGYLSVQDEALLSRKSALPMVLTNIEGNVLFASDTFYSFFSINSQNPASGIVKSLFIGDDTWDQITSQCLRNQSWEGYTIVSKSEDEELVLKISSRCIKGLDLLGPSLSIYFSETNDARQRIYRQGQTLKATSRCANLLISADNLYEALGEVVSQIGKSVSADRCYIYENSYLPDSEETYAQLLAQWNRRGLPDNTDDISFLGYSIFPDFLKTLKAHESYTRLASAFKGRTKELMDARKTKSMIAIPILKENELWGFLGFDDCKTERIWDEEEVAALGLLANTLSAILNRKELRDELQRKNDQLESAILGSKDSLWDYDVSKERIYYSPQFLELLGYERHELSGNEFDLGMLVHPNDLEGLYANLSNTLKKGEEMHDKEFRLLHKSGSILWVKVNAKPQKDLLGKVIRIAGSNTDITLEKNYQIRIKESQNRYIELVENLRETVFQLNKKGKISFLSTAWYSLSGYTPEESLNQKLDYYLHPDDVNGFKNMTRELFKSPHAYKNISVRIQRADAEEYWAEIYARSMQRQEGEPYILGTIIDVSQRRLAERKLEQSEEKYRLISDNISDMVCLQNADCEFVYVSPSVSKILGYSPDELVGKKPNEVFHRSNNTQEIPWFSEKECRNGRSSYRMKMKNGKFIWLETQFTTIGKEGSEGQIIQSTTRDISSHKKAEQSLQKALLKQKELNDLKSDFISMASHEFRTPLTTIRSSVQLLEEYTSGLKKETLEKSKKHFDRIKNQIERVTRLMNDVLILGRFDAGKSPFEPAKGDLSGFITELIHEHFSLQSDGRNIVFTQQGKPSPISYDPSLMNHVILNLVSNAFKYSEGKANPELCLDYTQADSVSIRVTDYGIGIPKSDTDKIFQSFFRSKNAISIPGTGLGLVITKEIVQLHKGQIRIESELNTKTDIIITLPK